METNTAVIDRFLRRWRFVAPANIEHFAARSAEFFGVSAFPRLAVTCLQEYGIVIRREPLPAGLDAVWTVEAGRHTVHVSSFIGSARANFTLWHEWFEMMASRPRFPSRFGTKAMERLADRYAAAITMPTAQVARLLQEFADSGDKADVMAARFGISEAAMRRRIQELAPARQGSTIGCGARVMRPRA